jgi:hypothetical protein
MLLWQGRCEGVDTPQFHHRCELPAEDFDGSRRIEAKVFANSLVAKLASPRFPRKDNSGLLFPFGLLAEITRYPRSLPPVPPFTGITEQNTLKLSRTHKDHVEEALSVKP